MYASMDWSRKGLAQVLMTMGVPITDLVRDGKPLSKRELVEMHNHLEFEREQAVFHEWAGRSGYSGTLNVSRSQV